MDECVRRLRSKFAARTRPGRYALGQVRSQAHVLSLAPGKWVRFRHTKVMCWFAWGQDLRRQHVKFRKQNRLHSAQDGLGRLGMLLACLDLPWVINLSTPSVRVSGLRPQANTQTCAHLCCTPLVGPQLMHKQAVTRVRALAKTAPSTTPAASTRHALSRAVTSCPMRWLMDF